MKTSHIVLSSFLALAIAAGVGIGLRHAEANSAPGYLKETVQRADIEASVMSMGSIDNGGLVVRASISEVDIAKVSVGQDAYFNAVGNLNQRYHGKVVSITAMPAVFTAPAPAADKGQQAAAEPAMEETDEAAADDQAADDGSTDVAVADDKTGDKKTAPRADVFYTVVFRVDQALPKLSSVMVHVVQGTVKQVPAISRLALQKPVGENRYVVEVIDAKGKLSQRTIETGLEDDLAIEVKSGLNLGDTVAIKDDGTLWEPGFRG